MSDNDSRARRSNGPRRRANHDKINWTKREPGPSPARQAQIERFGQALDCGDARGAKRVLNEPIAE